MLKILKKIGLFFFFLFLNFSSLILFVNQAQAQTIEPWGSHVICHGNDTMFEKIYNTYGGTRWYPVTILVQIVDGNETERINDVLEAARNNHIYPILRIGSSNDGRNWDKLKPHVVADVLNELNTSGFPQKIYAIYGNEANMSIEWEDLADPNDYKRNFNSFVDSLDKNKYIPIKAPVNNSFPPKNQQWEGVEGYGGQEFYKDMGVDLQTQGLDSHAYDLSGQGVRFPGDPGGMCGHLVDDPSTDADDVNTLMTIDYTLQVDLCFHDQLKYQNAPHIATEIGLGPAFTLQERINYIEALYSNHPNGYPQLDIATPLLLDDLRGAKEPVVPVFKADGSVEFIDCNNLGICGGWEACGGGQPTNNEPGNIYAQKDLNDYLTIPLILQPDKSLNDSGKLTDTLLYNMVIDQGYEVSCASPQLFIDPAAVDRLLDYFSHKNTEIPPWVDPSTKILELDASDSHKVQMVDAEIPIYRGSEASELTNKLSSYEAFFGTINPNHFDPDELVTSSGVASNLLSASQQCTIKLDNLNSAQTLCETLEDPAACALHRQIPETNYYLYSDSSQEASEPSLLTAINHYNLNCDQLTGNWDVSYESNISYQEFSNIQQAIINSPIDLDNLYRYAFVILSPMQDWDEDCDLGLSAADRTDRFWYLNWNPNVSECPGNYINRPKRVPIFVAFKIPTFATNKIESLPLQNSGQLTADTLNTQDTQDNKLEVQNRDSRGEFLGEINRIKQDIWTNGTNMQRLSLIIDCQGMPQCEGAYGQGTELRKALVHIVNGSGMSCKDTNFRQPNNTEDIIYDLDNPNPISAVESAKKLGTPAIYTINDGRVFQAPFFNVTTPSGKAMRWDWKLWLTKGMAEQIKSGDIPPEQKPVHENVGVHIVAPLGTDLTYIESAMTNLFAADQIEKLIESNVMVDVEGKSGNVARYFPIEDAKIGYEATGKEKYRHEDCPDEEIEICPPGGLLPCYKIKTGRKTDCATAGVKLKDDNVGLFIKGAKLGWFVRKIQEGITAATNPAYNYIASCERIGDLFLGRCGGNNQQTYGDYTDTIRDDAPNSCIYRGQSIDVPAECELVKLVQAKANQYDLDSNMIWGLLKIENPSFMRSVQNGEQQTECAVNACGAVGPMQIVQGVCVDLEPCMKLEAAFLGGNPEDWRDFVINSIIPMSRNVNPCDIEQAIDWTVETLNSRKSSAQQKIDNVLQSGDSFENWEVDLNCRLAGYHWGDADCSPNVSASCQGQSYCQCACEETVDVGSYDVDSGGGFNQLRINCGL